MLGGPPGDVRPKGRGKGPRAAAQRWTLDRVVFAALLMIYETGPSLCDRFAFARQTLTHMLPQRGRRPGRTYQGWVKAQKRFFGGRPERLAAIQQHLREAHQHVARQAWTVHGWVCFGADDSRVEVPRTAANELAFGCAGRDKTGPQLSLTTLYHLGTGLPWDWTLGGGKEAEREHLRRMLANLPPGSLLVADAGFTGYELLREILAAGHSFLIRVGSNVSLLTDLDCAHEQHGEEVWLWPGNQRKSPPLKLRLIRVAEPNGPATQPAGREMCLLTNVFDTARMSQATATELYRRRWGVEVFYRGLKQTLEQRKLRSDSPELAKLELFWGVTALLLLGLMSVDGMTQADDDPLQASVAEGLRVVRQATRTTRPWRRRGDLRVLLRQAVKDRYSRKAAKKARNWPHKKREKPPGLPRVRVATSREKQAARRLEQAA